MASGEQGSTKTDLMQTLIVARAADASTFSLREKGPEAEELVSGVWLVPALSHFWFL